MRTLSDNRFGEVIEPESVNELITLIIQGGTSPSPVVRMWRGQSDEKWLLDSSALRKVRRTKVNASEWDVASYENGLLEKARHKGFDRLEGRILNDFELLARLQHHGAATRLLDATRSGLIGLYFACAENHDRAGMLFGIHSSYLGGGEGVLVRESYEDKIKSIKDYKHPQTWEPPIVSARISAQHSQFVYSEIITGEKHGSLALQLDKALLTIRIPFKDKMKYLCILESNFDITFSSLFPDIDGFGRAYAHDRDQYANERW